MRSARRGRRNAALGGIHPASVSPLSPAAVTPPPPSSSPLPGKRTLFLRRARCCRRDLRRAEELPVFAGTGGASADGRVNQAPVPHVERGGAAADLSPPRERRRALVAPERRQAASPGPHARQGAAGAQHRSDFGLGALSDGGERRGQRPDFFCFARSPGSALNDGQWHSAALTSRKGRLTVAVDEDEGGFAHARPPFLLDTGSRLFFGGTSDGEEERPPRKGFRLADAGSAVLQVAPARGTSRTARTLSAPSRAACVC